MHTIYLLCESDETYGVTPVVFYTTKEQANDALHYIEAIKHDEYEKCEALGYNHEWTQEQKTERSQKYKAYQAEASRLVKTLHPKLQVYYDYIIVEVGAGQTVPAVQ